MSNLTPLSDRYFLFNLFEPPTDMETFLERWNKVASMVSTMDKHFIATYLHRSTDPAAKLPFCNFAVFDSPHCVALGEATPEFIEMTQNSMSGIAKAYPAGFREIASYLGKELVADDKLSKDSSGFFLTAAKAADTVTDSQFEESWKEWSGANLLHAKSEGNDLKDSLLYKRYTTNSPPAFRYTVRTEVENLSEASAHVIAKEINERKIPDGVETFTAFYKVAVTVASKMDKS